MKTGQQVADEGLTARITLARGWLIQPDAESETAQV
jgi:hypothetical protein